MSVRAYERVSQAWEGKVELKELEASRDGVCLGQR